MTEGRDGPPRSGTGPDGSRQEQHPLPDFCVDADSNESPPKSKEKGGGGDAVRARLALPPLGMPRPRQCPTGDIAPGN